jgi:hypothetical protein
MKEPHLIDMQRSAISGIIVVSYLLCPKRGMVMTSEKFTVSGSELIDKIKQLIHEGNIRRVRVLHEGRVVLEIPLSIGAPVAAIGIIAVPVLAALGAFAALVTECTIEVEKAEPPLRKH